MPRRKILLKENIFYHVYNRALDKKTIFKNKRDFIKFLSLLLRYLKKNNWINIYAYAILPNHFHLLLYSKNSWKEISKFMGQLQQAYSKYFKLRYKKEFKGRKWVTLFQGRFKSKFVLDKDYANELVKYINFNPIKHWLVENIEDYMYTSYYFYTYKIDKFGIILEKIKI